MDELDEGGTTLDEGGDDVGRMGPRYCLAANSKKISALRAENFFSLKNFPGRPIAKSPCVDDS